MPLTCSSPTTGTNSNLCLEKELQNSQILSASNFLTQEQPDKSPKVLRHDFLKRNGYAFGASPTAIHQSLIGEFAE